MTDRIHRRKRLDDGGAQVQLLADGRVRVTPPVTAPAHIRPVTFDAEDWDAAVEFVAWARKTLPRRPGGDVGDVGEFGTPPT